MSSVFIEGIGYVAIDSNKSEAERQATVKYYKEIAPKYKEVDDSFFDGAINGSPKSQIYEWGKKLTTSDDETKDRWFQGQIEEWGNMVGIYDSIALAKYYEDIAKEGDLTKGEQADKEANAAVLNQFKQDMHYVYDNNEKDVSQIQQKYGYEPEEIGTLEALSEMGKMFVDKPFYTAGSMVGMLAKDPQYLLMGYLRIPKMASGLSQSAVQLAAQASRIQPKYVQQVGRFMQNSRVQGGIGRGVEAATYGGVYEALHDLTFKGSIDASNVKRGIALGALIGTAFGGIAGRMGNSNWMVSKLGSEKALSKVQPKSSKPKTDGDTTEPTILDNVNQNFRNDTKIALLPEGLSHTARENLWINSGIKTLEDAWLKKNPNKSIKESRVRQQHTKELLKEKKELGKLKREDGSALFSPTQIKGLAAKNVAQKLELENVVDYKKLKIKEANDPKWGNRRETKQGKKDLKDGKVIREKDTFSDTFNNADATPVKATAKQIAAFGAAGAAVGAFITDEDKEYGALIGMLIAGGLRTRLTGLDVNQAKLKMKFYSAADNAARTKREGQLYTGKTMQLLKSVLMGDNPKMSHLTFLDHIENYSKPAWAKLRKSLDPDIQVGLAAVTELMRKYKADAKKYGVLKNEQFVDDYIAHIFRQGNQPKDLVKIKTQLQNILDTSTSSALPRKLQETISTIAKKYPQYKIETDVFKILDGYSKSMTKAITGSQLVKEVTAVGVLHGKETIGLVITEGANKAIDVLVKKMGYKEVAQPALKGKLVHPLIAKSFEDFFYSPVGTNLILNGAITVTNALKRIAVTWSFFHAQSLILSAAYAGAGAFSARYLPKLNTRGAARMTKVRELMDGKWEANVLKHDKDGVPIIENNMLPDQVYGDFLHRQTLKELAEHGIGVGVKANEFVDAGYSTMKKIYDDYLPVIGKVQDKIDKITWDIMHDHLKIFTYLTVKERAMATRPRGLGKVLPKKWMEDWKPLNNQEAGAIAGKYVNNAFGGQSHSKLALEWQAKAIENANNPKGEFYNWMAVATSPSKARLSNLFAFSPDWTVSNIRIAFRGMGMSKDLVSKVYKGGKLTTKEIAEWNMYAGYMTRGLIITSFMAYLAHSFLADDDTEFNLTDFWVTGRLGLGGGEEMVISKQIAEPLHWLMHPMNTAWNKSSTFPKTMMEIILGKEYVTFKHPNYLGPNIEGAKGYAIYGASKITPISGNPFKRFMTEDNYSLGDAAKATFGGIFGFPFYKSSKQ